MLIYLKVCCKILCLTHFEESVQVEFFFKILKVLEPRVFVYAIFFLFMKLNNNVK